MFKWAVWDRLTGKRRPAPPGPPAPVVRPNAAALADPAGPHRLTWLGHAGFLGTLGGASFLVDPVLGSRVGFFYARHGPSPLDPGELPPLAALLVSHNHYDHLDAWTVRALPRSTPVVVPAGLGGWFRRRGFTNVAELEWWQSIRRGPLDVTLVPARHWSRRSFWDMNLSGWGGFVVAGGGTTVYHAGDSAAFDGFAEIGRRFPGLDAALLPIGAYEPEWFMASNHMNPEAAGEAFLAVGAKRLVPTHWGTFQLTDEPLLEPMARLERWWASRNDLGDRSLARLAVGGTLEL